MYIIKNALTSIRRNKGRNILIAIIIIVVSAASAISLSIMNSADTIVAAYNDKYAIEATIEMNRENVMKELTEDTDSQEDKINKFNDIETLTITEIELYGDSKYLKDFYYTYSIGVDAKDLEEATDTLEKETTTTTTKKQMPKGGGPGRPGGFSTTTTTKKYETISNPNALNGAFTLVGYSSYSGMSEFINGNYAIIEGIVDDDFTKNSCVINEELAKLNNLKVGDAITIINPDNNDLTYELIITGIFKDNEETTDMYGMYTNSVNNIITNLNFVKKLSVDDEDIKYSINPTYILNNKNDFDSFKNEVSAKGLSEYYQVTSNIETIEKETASINNVKTFAITFLLITLVIGIIVLLVINMINVRERKYEIGVLRTIGMKKSLVISQFVFELVVVSIFALLIGAGIGAYASVPIANKLLENEISKSTIEIEDIKNNFGNKEGFKDFRPNGVAAINQVTEINAVVDFKVLSQLLGIGLILTFISSISAMISIANFSPLTILKERS